jgi:transcriptional regulator with XRE-family HTH domain
MSTIIRTHLMREEKMNQKFGSRLTDLRVSSGYDTQADLARVIKTVTQQTISRWEKGLSRPRSKDIARLAAVLNIDADILFAEAGYTTQNQVVATFDQPFPVDSLSPESFERFCLYFLQKTYPSAQVHAAGHSGHKQNGIDITVLFEDKTRYAFQCKRKITFGPKEVQRVIESDKEDAVKKFILLSRVASPQARAEANKNSSWDIWDKVDITLKARGLPLDEQIKLVDIFFRGQRLALLGELEAGPWTSIEDFFLGFLDQKKSSFNHLWSLVGRETESNSLLSFIEDEAIPAVFLVGSGGVGKSRLLYQALNAFEKNKPNTLVRFLSSGEALSAKSLELLGTSKKIIIVDDAHDQEDLPILFKYVSNPKNLAKIILSLRDYGYERIKLDAANYHLQPPYTAEVKLKPLSEVNAVQLATQVLKHYSGPVEAANDIAKFTANCTLATVIAAQIVSIDRVDPHLLNGEEQFKNILLGRFQKILTGEIAGARDQAKLNGVLRVISLVQPISLDDASFLNLVEKLEGISIQESNRLLRLIVTGGVLFKRGRRYKLAPDLLADQIIQDACITQNEESSGYAERAFDAMPQSMIENLLVNLGRLDWRRGNGDVRGRRLLNGLWDKLNPNGDHGNAHFQAMSSAAYYQPDRALQYAEESIREGKEIKDLTTLIHHAAYNLSYVRRACLCLWQLGKLDARPKHQHPSHAIRLMSELCAVEPNKPIEYNAEVVAFGLDLLKSEEAFLHANDPYEVLSGILQTEGHQSILTGHQISLNPYQVRQSAVADLRKQVIDAAIKNLTNLSNRIAIRSAQILHAALRYPMGAFGSEVTKNADYDLWTQEFLSTLEKIKTTVYSNSISSLTWLELIKSISWHANYSKTDTREAAKEILILEPESLDHQLIRVLYDGYGHLLDGPDFSKRQARIDAASNYICDHLFKAFSRVDSAADYITKKLDHIRSNTFGRAATPRIFIYKLCEIKPEFAREILIRVSTNNNAALREFASIALNRIYEFDLQEGRKQVAKMMQMGDQFQELVAESMPYAIEKTNCNDFEFSILKNLLTTGNPRLTMIAGNALRPASLHQSASAVELIVNMNFCDSPQIVNEILGILPPSLEEWLDRQNPEVLLILLKKIVKFPELSGHWIEVFLSYMSCRQAIQTFIFFKDRVDYATQHDDYSFRPCNYGPYVYVPLKFNESEDYDRLLNDAWAWMRSNQNASYVFSHHAAHLFQTIFNSEHEKLLLFMKKKIQGDIHDVNLVIRVVRDFSSTFVFNQQNFVLEFLRAANSHGIEILNAATTGLYCATTTGMRSGVAGKPFPEDIEIMRKAEEILQMLSAFSPGYRLYKLISEHAKKEIDARSQEVDDSDY